jgi:hypothetical protein
VYLTGLIVLERKPGLKVRPVKMELAGAWLMVTKKSSPKVLLVARGVSRKFRKNQGGF